jgi:general secretion pathway protein G
MLTRLRLERGFTFVEMLVVVALVAVLASAVMPLAKVASQRAREVELRRALREMRTAIDHYKDAVDQGQIPASKVRPGSEGYPPDLETLVVGVEAAGQGTGERKLKFLRRIPIDPMTREAEWGMRSYEDKPDSRTWGGQNVYDVYSKSDGTALDGTKYRDW